MASSNIERIRQKRVAVRLTVLAMICLCLVIFLASRGNETENSGPVIVLEDSVTPILAYLSMPVRGAENLLSDLRDRNKVHIENQRLKQELYKLQDAEMRANALALKIAKFESLLNVDISSGISETKIAARAVSERDGPFVRSALIDAGSDKDVRKGYAIMTYDGLYGHVVRVGKRSSRGLKLTDLNSRVAVMSLRSEGRAILTGDNTDFPSLSYVSNTDDWKVGDTVVTSGDDGVLPRGLPVGRVRAEKTGNLKVDLNVDGTRVDWVLVIPFERIAAISETDDVDTEIGDVASTVGSVAEDAVGGSQSSPPAVVGENRLPEDITGANTESLNDSQNSFQTGVQSGNASGSGRVPARQSNLVDILPSSSSAPDRF